MIQKVFCLGYKVLERVFFISGNFIIQLICHVIFFGQGIRFDSFIIHGIPYVSVARSGECKIGHGFKMNNGLRSNPIGPPQRCIIYVAPNAHLNIGDNEASARRPLCVFIKLPLEIMSGLVQDRVSTILIFIL